MIDVYDFMARGGTYKDVGSPEMVTDAVRREINTICVISSGNLSSSLLKEIRNRGLEEKIGFVNLVNQKPREKYDVQIPPRRILRNDAEREAWVRDQVSGAGIVKDYTDYIPESLRGVAEEILEGEPDFVSLGIGGGKLFLSLYNVIKQKGISTRLIGVVPRKDNGVFNDEKLIEEEGNLMFRGKIYGSVADKLATPYSHYKRALLEAMRNGHFIVEARNRDFVKANREAVKKGYEAEVSGSAGFTILDKSFVRRHDLPLTPESHVRVINTGKGKLNVIRRRKPLRKVLSTVATFVAGGI